LKLREAWKLSKFPYIELAYRSIQMSRGGGSQELNSADSDQKKFFNSTIRSAKISKVAFSIFATIGAGFPFLQYVVSPSPESLVSAISLSMAISLAYIVFYSLQILPSLSKGEAYNYLWTLPIQDRDFSLVAVFSFIRTFDYLAICSSFVQVVAVWALTGSLVATLLMVVAALANVVFAVAIALWLSGLFYRNLSRGKATSSRASIFRLLFLVGWGFCVMSIAFLFNFVSFILPYLTNTIAGNITGPLGLLLSVLHPFSLSLVISNAVFPNLFTPIVPAGAAATQQIIPPFVPPIVAYSSTIAYVALALGLAKRTFVKVSGIARGHGIKVAREQMVSMFLKIRTPLRAFVLKDLRLAARNPSMAFLYASPLFETITLAVVTVQFPVMRTSAMIVSTLVGCFFTIMICSTLLNTEGAGLDYTLSLPVRSKTVIYSKALVASLTFIPVPLTLLAIGLSKPLTSGYSIFIPFVEFLAVAAACLAEIKFFIGGTDSRGKRLKNSTKGMSPMAGSDITRLVASLIISFVILIIPVAAFAITYLESGSHELGLFAMLFAASIEFLFAIWKMRGGASREKKGDKRASHMILLTFSPH
jgi:predicted permease